jgi:hypothetical protein
MFTTLILLALAQPVEVVPGLITTDHLEIDTIVIKAGMPAAQAAAALGRKPPKGGKYSLRKIASEVELMQNLAPSSAIDGAPINDLMAQHCAKYDGLNCYQALILHKIDKTTEARIALFGPTADSLTVGFIVVDQGRAIVARWYARERAESNARFSRYYLTPSGGYRVFRQDRTVRFEKVR